MDRTRDEASGMEVRHLRSGVGDGRLLDLYCGAGGTSMGYHQAGFEVTGVDRMPHEDYPFPMLITDTRNLTVDQLREYDVIAASPPCPAHSTITPKVSRPN